MRFEKEIHDITIVDCVFDVLIEDVGLSIYLYIKSCKEDLDQILGITLQEVLSPFIEEKGKALMMSQYLTKYTISRE